jgi:two-component system NtrC family response regulator
MIRRAIDACGGSKSEAARRLGIHRQLLYKKLKQHGLE